MALAAHPMGQYPPPPVPWQSNPPVMPVMPSMNPLSQTTGMNPPLPGKFMVLEFFLLN
jgi:hypothetical protein